MELIVLLELKLVLPTSIYILVCEISKFDRFSKFGIQIMYLVRKKNVDTLVFRIFFSEDLTENCTKLFLILKIMNREIRVVLNC